MTIRSPIVYIILIIYLDGDILIIKVNNVEYLYRPRQRDSNVDALTKRRGMRTALHSYNMGHNFATCAHFDVLT